MNAHRRPVPARVAARIERRRQVRVIGSPRSTRPVRSTDIAQDIAASVRDWV